MEGVNVNIKYADASIIRDKCLKKMAENNSENQNKLGIIEITFPL